MKLNDDLYQQLLAEARSNPRLRKAMDLRTTPEDQSQRILNALIPGTQVPIHRHTTSSETAIILMVASTKCTTMQKVTRHNAIPYASVKACRYQ